MYRSSYAETAYGLALDGKTDEEIAKHFAVSLSTFYVWMADHPKFGSALEQGRSMSEYLGLGERGYRDYHQGGGYGLYDGLGGSAYAPYPAPSGWAWNFVYEGAAMVTEAGSPVVELGRR